MYRKIYFYRKCRNGHYKQDGCTNFFKTCREAREFYATRYDIPLSMCKCTFA